MHRLIYLLILVIFPLQCEKIKLFDTEADNICKLLSMSWGVPKTSNIKSEQNINVSIGGHPYLLRFDVSLDALFPDEPDVPLNYTTAEKNKMASAARLAALRAVMASQPAALAAYVIPTADAHNSEYIAPVDARREWISGFTGSAGTAVVTSQAALVWTDGRYYTQFEKETDSKYWTLMKQSLPDTPSIEKWLSTNLNAGDEVGVDPHTMTREEWSRIEKALRKANMELIAVSKNLIDEVRAQLQDPPPARPHNGLIPLPVKYTGRPASEKIHELRGKMAEKKASALVVTALDEVACGKRSDVMIPLPLKYTGRPASLKIQELRERMSEKKASELVLTALDEISYTLNIRGSDIEYNPVFFSYLVITPRDVTLFWGDGQLPPAVVEHLKGEGVEVHGKPYGEIEEHLKSVAKTLSSSGGKHSIWLSGEASEAIHRAAAGHNHIKNPLDLISEVSPVALMKLIKNEVELEGFRRCHIRDGIAVVRLFRWLHERTDRGATVTEIQAADKLLQLRKDEADFMGPSFETIAAAGEHGAIIHYSPSREGPQKVIDGAEIFLLDSGGQYKDGTTDITRTRHMSRNATAAQRAAFTRVLKGQIAFGSALFPQGVKGNVLDSFARKALWDVGLDYAHGTGHGVGHFLNVHEGPSGVSWRPYPHDPGLKPRQILSNEPGYYKVGEYGIRHEDLVETIAVTKNSDHPRAATLVGDCEGRGVLGFHTITMVPHQRESLDLSLLDDFELSYLNAYHKRVCETLGPILQSRGLTDDLHWLEGECAPIHKI